MNNIFLSFIFLLFPVFFLSAQTKITELADPNPHRSEISYFEDGFLISLSETALHIYDFRGAKIDTFSLAFPKEMEDIYKLGHRFSVENEAIFYTCFNYDVSTHGYRLHRIKIANRSIEDYKNFPIKYAFDETAYDVIDERATVIAFMSGKDAYIYHHSLTRDREIFRTPLQSYVANPNATGFAFNSNFTMRGSKATFIIQEPQSKSPLFCLHDIDTYETQQFRLEIPEMPHKWSTTKMLLAEDASKAWCFGAGYDSYDSKTGEKGKSIEGIIELDFRQKKTRFLNLSLFFTDTLEKNFLKRIARVYETRDHIFMAYAYQFSISHEEPEKHKQSIIAVDKKTFEGKLIYDTKSKFAKTMYLYKNKRIEWYTDYSGEPPKPKSVMAVFEFEK